MYMRNPLGPQKTRTFGLHSCVTELVAEAAEELVLPAWRFGLGALGFRGSGVYGFRVAHCVQKGLQLFHNDQMYLASPVVRLQHQILNLVPKP